jgi:chemotaxis signal transduction protein
VSATREPAALVVHVGNDVFAIWCADVVTVLPLPTLRPLPGAPPALLGTFSYGGAIVPVIDLAQALSGVATGDSLAVRVVLSSTPDGLVGVLVGRVGVRRVSPPDRRLAVSRHPVVADAVVIDGRPVHMLTLGSAMPPELRGLMASP